MDSDMKRPGFGEFANVPGQIHFKPPTEKQLQARTGNNIKEQSPFLSKPILPTYNNNNFNQWNLNGYIQIDDCKIDLSKIDWKKEYIKQQNPIEELRDKIDWESKYNELFIKYNVAKKKYGDLRNTTLPNSYLYNELFRKYTDLLAKNQELNLHVNELEIRCGAIGSDEEEEDDEEEEEEEDDEEEEEEEDDEEEEEEENKKCNIDNWRKLKIGISREEVKEILGEPYFIRVDPTGEKWSYGDEADHYNIYSNFGDLVFETQDYEYSKGLKYWCEPIHN